MTKVFFSYSHADERLRDRLEKHLTMLKRDNLIQSWHDRRIPAGDDFAKEIDANLESADIVLLLISPDFLSSAYCYEIEMSRAMQKHQNDEAKVIPIILHYCDWKTAPFGKLNAVPKDGKPITSFADENQGFLEVVEMIRAALPKSSSKFVSTEVKQLEKVEAVSPMRSSNLRLRKSFSEADAEDFLEKAFDYMTKFFENSLVELSNRNSGIECKFRKIDANRFTGIVFQTGKAVSRCRIRFNSGLLGKGISFSFNDQAEDNSYNENLTVKFDDQNLFLRATGMPHSSFENLEHLSMEGASEYYWSLFIRDLQ